MRLLACGDKAILVELQDADERRQLEEALRRDPINGVLEHVPAPGQSWSGRSASTRFR